MAERLDRTVAPIAGAPRGFRGATTAPLAEGRARFVSAARQTAGAELLIRRNELER